mmetsp:Transcript_19454/g.44276  ORF Transcript_19454/g.44276 Transcript_19454/m.44276 type:complete len:381 (+) Transcript_19454:246-1388(+)
MSSTLAIGASTPPSSLSLQAAVSSSSLRGVSRFTPSPETVLIHPRMPRTAPPEHAMTLMRLPVGPVPISKTSTVVPGSSLHTFGLMRLSSLRIMVPRTSHFIPTLKAALRGREDMTLPSSSRTSSAPPSPRSARSVSPKTAPAKPRSAWKSGRSPWSSGSATSSDSPPANFDSLTGVFESSSLSLAFGVSDAPACVRSLSSALALRALEKAPHLEVLRRAAPPFAGADNSACGARPEACGACCALVLGGLSSREAGAAAARASASSALSCLSRPAGPGSGAGAPPARHLPSCSFSSSISAFIAAILLEVNRNFIACASLSFSICTLSSSASPGASAATAFSRASWISAFRALSAAAASTDCASAWLLRSSTSAFREATSS